MDNSKQVLTYSRPTFGHDAWCLLGYFAAALLVLAVILAGPKAPAVPDPSFATDTVLP